MDLSVITWEGPTGVICVGFVWRLMAILHGSCPRLNHKSEDSAVRLVRKDGTLVDENVAIRTEGARNSRDKWTRGHLHDTRISFYRCPHPAILSSTASLEESPTSPMLFLMKHASPPHLDLETSRRILCAYMYS